MLTAFPPINSAYDKMVELSIVLWVRDGRVNSFQVWRKEMPIEFVIIPNIANTPK